MRSIPIEVLHDHDVIVVSARMPDIDAASLRVDVGRAELTVVASAAGEEVRFSYPIPFVADHRKGAVRFADGVLRVVLTPKERAAEWVNAL